MYLFLPQVDMRDILRLASDEELYELLKIHKDNYHFYAIYNHIKWTEYFKNVKNGETQETTYKCKFYIPRLNTEKFGTYLAICDDGDYNLSFHSLEEKCIELLDCLEQTEIIDWQRELWLNHIQEGIFPRIKKFLQMKNVECYKEIPCECLILDRERATKLDPKSVPAGYELRELSEAHAQIVNDWWPYKTNNSEKFIANLIKINGGIGIFKRTNNNQLVACILQNEFSGPGILYVVEEERRKGYGSILTMTLSKRIADNEKLNVIIFVNVHNDNSFGMCKTIGFEKTDCGIWAHCWKIRKENGN